MILKGYINKYQYGMAFNRNIGNCGDIQWSRGARHAVTRHAKTVFPCLEVTGTWYVSYIGMAHRGERVVISSKSGYAELGMPRGQE